MVMRKKTLIETTNAHFTYEKMKDKFYNVHQRRLRENEVIMVELGNGDADLKSDKKIIIKGKDKTVLGIDYLMKILDFYKKLDCKEVLFKIGDSKKVNGIASLQSITEYKKGIIDKPLPIRVWLAPRTIDEGEEFEKEIIDLLSGKEDRSLRLKLKRAKKDKLIEAL